MFRKIQWRIAVAYVALIVVVMLSLWIYLTTTLRAQQPAVLEDQLAVVVIVAMSAATALAILLAAVVARVTTDPIGRLTTMARRVASGDLDQTIAVDTRDEVGQLAEAFNEMASDLRRTIGAIEEERSEIAAILAGMADGVAIVDEEGRVVALNRAAERMLETVEATARGRSVAEVVRQHELVEHLTRGSPPETPLVITLGRDRRQVQVVVTPVKVADRTHQVVLLQDVTELRRAEAIRRDFVANVSHELRTPLASLRALVETLEDGALDDPPAAREFLTRMHVEVDGLSQMVEELLELARIESGRVQLRFARSDVGRLVEAAAERLRPQAERHGLTLTIHLPSEPLIATIDADRLHQVVVNLVHNAVKFTPPGGSITVSVEHRGEEVGIVVADTGIGVSARDLPRLFERFYKTDRSRASSGTGLGLAIVKHLVQAHGGHVRATSAGEGQGTTFTVLLPSEGPASPTIPSFPPTSAQERRTSRVG